MPRSEAMHEAQNAIRNIKSLAENLRQQAPTPFSDQAQILLDYLEKLEANVATIELEGTPTP